MPNSATIKPLRVAVFAGSAFAQPTIGHLIQHNLLAGVILPATGPQQNVTPEVQQLAQLCASANIPWLLAGKDNVNLVNQTLTQWQANAGLIATYPHLLNKDQLDYFDASQNRGIYNLHASALPAYRGPQPLYWQLRNHEKESAIILHKATTTADAGNIIHQHPVPIHPLDTLPSLSQRMAYESIACCEQWIAQLKNTSGALAGIAQIQSSLSKPNYAHRPSPEERTIRFGKMTATDINALCRAGNASAYTALMTIKGLSINVLQATAVSRPTYGTLPGTVLHVGEPEGLLVCAKNSTVRLDILASPDGIYTGQAFAERFDIDAGTPLEPSNTFSNTFFQQPA